MADIDVVEQLDWLDRYQVVCYRLGISLAGLALLSPLLTKFAPVLIDIFRPLLMLAAVLLASSLHVYSKNIRFALANSTWLALLLFCFNALLNLNIAAEVITGFLFITLSGVCYKESFCFRIPGLKLMPVILPVCVLAQFFGLYEVYLATSSAAALVALSAAFAKWRMPLHFDIGDKSKYQV